MVNTGDRKGAGARLEPGEVWLVGAGPGDPGLLTLRAAEALANADIVFYDALVSDAILALVRPGAARVYAGRRCGGTASPGGGVAPPGRGAAPPGEGTRADMHKQLIARAREGKRVLRLKGGDPCMFGRGGEEALALAEAGVPFRVVPGITAGIGGPEAAGIPPTHRGVNHAVLFATGHAVDTLDWDALARAAPVLVFYMALGQIGEIAARLIAAGRPPHAPLAVISNATLPDERVLKTQLATAERDTAEAQMMPPAIIIIGQRVSWGKR